MSVFKTHVDTGRKQSILLPRKYVKLAIHDWLGHPMEDVYEEAEISIRSSAAEYLTFVASTGDSAESIEMRYEDENIWLTQKMMAELYNRPLAKIK